MVWGIDLSITNEVVLLWVGALVTFVLLGLACRRREPVPRGAFQNLFEALIDFVQESIIKDSLGPRGAVWTPFLLTLFFIILFCNLLGVVPLPSHAKSITSNLNVTAGLAVTVFGLTVIVSLRHHGLGGFLRKFKPAGVPPLMLPLVVPIEIISWLARPFSLALRLFANMLAGHTLILVFVGMTVAANVFLKPLPLVGAVAMTAFEIFASVIQAFIFTMLSGLYLREALEEAH